MSIVVRWGRAAYETHADLLREQKDAERLGYEWRPIASLLEAKDFRAEVLVTHSGNKVDAKALDHLRPALVLTTTSGYDHVDLRAARSRGIAVARCPLARRDAVVESTIGALITLFRRQHAFDAAAKEGRWARGDLPELGLRTLQGAPIAVVGLGVIGSRLAEVLRMLGARVIGVDPAGCPPGVDPSELEPALRKCAAVTLHCSLTPSSANLLSMERLAMLPRGAIVVNTARGDILDVQAAVDFVYQERLGGLAVDVFPVEPYPKLAKLAQPGVLLTPHAAGFSMDLGARVATEVAAGLAAWKAGRHVPARVV